MKNSVLASQLEWIRSYSSRVQCVAGFVRALNRADGVRNVLESAPKVLLNPTPSAVAEHANGLNSLASQRRRDLTLKLRAEMITGLRDATFRYSQAKTALARMETIQMQTEEFRARYNAARTLFISRRNGISKGLLDERDRLAAEWERRREGLAGDYDKQIQEIKVQTKELLEENRGLSRDVRRYYNIYRRLTMIKAKPLSFFVGDSRLQSNDNNKEEWEREGEMEVTGKTETRTETRQRASILYDLPGVKVGADKEEEERRQIVAKELLEDARKLGQEHEELQRIYAKLRQSSHILVENRRLVHTFLVGLLREVDELGAEESLGLGGVSLSPVFSKELPNSSLPPVGPVSLCRAGSTLAEQNYCCLMRSPDRSFHELLKAIQEGHWNVPAPSLTPSQVETCCLLLLENLQLK